MTYKSLLKKAFTQKSLLKKGFTQKKSFKKKASPKKSLLKKPSPKRAFYTFGDLKCRIFLQKIGNYSLYFFIFFLLDFLDVFFIYSPSLLYEPINKFL